ncbi:MAG: alkaline phosphatase [Verrucomicrobiota bacterium]|nr:alkaline phosphatase [Verrucomicrobiota bacterium]
MKLRNQLLALFCLLVFVALGVVYVQTWVVQRSFAIILFVSDAMVTRHLATARLYEGGSDHRLAIESFPYTAIVANHARDFAVPDAAAAATALATGQKVNHRHLASDHRGSPLRSLLEIGKAKGRAVGLVTNGQLTDPTPAAFYAHVADARDPEPIAAQLVDAASLDVALGGGSQWFLPAAGGGKRKDGRDLMGELRRKGRALVTNNAELENASSYQENGIVGFFSEEALAFTESIESATQEPSLADMVRRGIQFLETNRKGYVLVVDGALVTHAAERNEGERVLIETLALDRAIAEALRYAGEKSLVVAVGKHAVGGFSLNGYPLRKDHGVALLGMTPSGYPAITWATGPNGPPVEPAAAPAPPRVGIARHETAAFQTPWALGTVEDVIAAGTGPGTEKLRGFIDNTRIFELLEDAL